MRKAGRRVENPEAIGEVSEAEFARLPDLATLFAARAARLRAVAEGNPLSDYLLFLAAIVEAQHDEAQIAPEPNALDEAACDRAIANAMPPLTPALLSATPDFDARLVRVLNRIDRAFAPEEAQAARSSLLAASPDDRLALAEGVFQAAFPADRLAECVFVAAALQAFLAPLAARLPGRRLRSVGDCVCPACGGAPLASLIVSWPRANRLRYCACSLCGSFWNHVRIKCTFCGSTEDIGYLSIEEGSRDTAIETCGKCHCYIKHFHKDRAPDLEPLADDVASFGLDLMVRNEGYRRAGVNPLFVTG